MYTYSETISHDDVARVHALLKETYWAADRNCDDMKTCLESSLVMAAYHQGLLVGFARAVTDKVFFSWICDVVVDPDHRGRGLGRKLVANILAHPDVLGTRKVLVTRDAQELYKGFGFVTHPSECMVAYPEKER